MSQGIKTLQQKRTQLRDAIVRIRTSGEPTFGVVNENDRDDQARIFVRRLLAEAGVNQRQFAALIGSHTSNFNQWLNHPGDRFIECLRVIRFLTQLLYEIYDDMIATTLQKENDRDKDDEEGASGASAIVGEGEAAVSFGQKNIEELTSAISGLSTKEKQASVKTADRIDVEPKHKPLP
ncbi:unnamed protein product [Adineta ricciae]|uniref:Uncharacterized protein n=1 Tax=Adineta ricciae TaxID=249248 RepID=A0A815HCW2_ADIRI|nr:unnamed protein product [Adineta ricciae]CAF1350676.1 unnamed protein product [Adineta ricciae]